MPRQVDGTTCGPTVAMVAAALLDPTYQPSDPDAEQRRIHAAVNLVWPRRLGTTPFAMVKFLAGHSDVRYGWRGPRARRNALDAADSGWPVPVLIGNVVPRHWVLLIGPGHYDPSPGEFREDRTRFSYPRVFGFVLPTGITGGR